MSSTEAAEDIKAGDAEKSPAAAAKKSSDKLSLTALLVLGCGALGLYAAFGPPLSKSKAISRETSSTSVSDTAATPPGHPPLDAAGQAVNAPKLGGVVQEVVQVSNYTYLRVVPKGGAEFWAAVTKTNVPEGSSVSFEGAEMMTGFTSKELGRTFDRIYFARLSSGAGLNPHAGGEFAAPTDEEGKAAKKAAALVAEEIPVKPSERAQGPLGRTVGELYEHRAELVGKKVRVRGTVVRVTRQVMGTNFLHIRDGSGNAGSGSHDLTLKVAEDPPKLGAEAQFEGTLSVDVDLGAGYAYPVLLEDARIVAP